MKIFKNYHFPYKEINTILHKGKFKFYLVVILFISEINFTSVFPTAFSPNVLLTRFGECVIVRIHWLGAVLSKFEYLQSKAKDDIIDELPNIRKANAVLPAKFISIWDIDDLSSNSNLICIKF